MENIIDYQFIIWLAYVVIGVLYVGKKTFRKVLAEDARLPFSTIGYAEMITKRHHFHFLYTGFIIASLVALATVIQVVFKVDLQIVTASAAPMSILGLLLGLVMNFLRESYLSRKGGRYRDSNGKWAYIVPFDWRDVRYGAYGGWISAIGCGLLLALLKVII